MVKLETKKKKYELFMKKLKPVFQMIVTIAVIAEKKNFSDRIDHMKTTLQRSQRQRSSSISVIAVAAIATIAGKWFPYDRSDRRTFFLSDHMETGLKRRKNNSQFFKFH